MKANHVHVGVRDLPAAVGWLERVWELKPVFQIPEMAIFAVGEFELFLDAAEHDTRTTIGFVSDDCDRDYGRVDCARRRDRECARGQALRLARCLRERAGSPDI